MYKSQRLPVCKMFTNVWLILATNMTWALHASFCSTKQFFFNKKLDKKRGGGGKEGLSLQHKHIGTKKVTNIAQVYVVSLPVVSTYHRMVSWLWSSGNKFLFPSTDSPSVHMCPRSECTFHFRSPNNYYRDN